MTTMTTATSKTRLYETLQSQMNDLNRKMGYSQISTTDDPRISLTERMNITMDAMTPDEQDYLLDKWNR